MRKVRGRLNEIVEHKRRDVASGLKDITLDALHRYAEPTTRSLEAALKKPGARFVMEVKRASPSAGDLRFAVDAGAQALCYKGAADAISVLTDGRFFKGSLDDLTRVRRVFDGPILAKDFIVDVRQVVEARMFGADAVLVILSVLSPDEARAVMHEARLLGMDVLVEVHDERELGEALDLGARLIGINNRNLATFRTDLGVTERLAPRVPKDRILVAESGIENRADVERLSVHVDAFLVGSALMRAEDPALAAREFAFGRVKVCGLTSEEDAIAAAECGASHAGMVFVPETPRAISGPAARPIAEAARSRGLKAAGVFRNADPGRVGELAHSLELAVVQLHGSEDANYVGELRRRLPEATEIWAACGVGASPPMRKLEADRTLFDTEINGKSGGTGKKFDWSRLGGGLARGNVLAGGLTPSNARAAATTGAWALDVGSGVEARPGVKSVPRLQRFFGALRAPSRSGASPCR